MIRDIHTHHHPATPGEAIVQLTPDVPSPQSGHYYSVGLHPWHVDEDWKTQMAKVAVIALHPQVLMLGEAGLDKKHGTAPIELQAEVFREHVRLSELLHKPLIIHCVKAFDEVLAIRKETKTAMPWIIHGFRGGVEQWMQLSRAGLHISIGHHYNEELIKQLSLQQLLVESDDTTDLESVYGHISRGMGIATPELQQTVWNNILHLYGNEA